MDRERLSPDVIILTSEPLDPAEPEAHIDSPLLQLIHWTSPLVAWASLIWVSVTCNERSLDYYSPYLIIKEFADPRDVERKGKDGKWREYLWNRLGGSSNEHIIQESEWTWEQMCSPLS